MYKIIRKNLLNYVALVTISLMIFSCTKSDSIESTPTPSQATSAKWSFSFRMNGQNYEYSSLTDSLTAECEFDMDIKRVNISWWTDNLFIQLPSDTVGIYLVNNNRTYITYTNVAGSLLGVSTFGDRIEIISSTEEYITGTFTSNLVDKNGNISYKITNGKFKAIKKF